VAVNACRRLYRRGRYDPHPTDVVPLDAASPTGVRTGRSHDLASRAATPEQHLLRAELAAGIADALARLPEHYRTVVLLRDRDGWSSQATAAALCLSGPAMKSRLHRARTLLRRALAGYLEP
jgi:RNA polymerase sigma-70 factor (ECF subfamily)